MNQFAPGLIPSQVYDCFTFFGSDAEFKLLRIRAEELRPLNVIHVLVESPFTFSGKPKPLYFQERKEEFKDIPIFHLIVNGLPSEDPWRNEQIQRDACMIALHKCNDEDIIIIADADEVVKAEAVKQYRDGIPEPASLGMDLFYYYLNVRSERNEWKIAKIIHWADLKNTTPNVVRNGGTPVLMLDAGYHWTYQGDVQSMLTKFASFSHQEEAVQKHATQENLSNKYSKLQSLWGENILNIVDLRELPQYVQDHQEEFKELIYVQG